MPGSKIKIVTILGTRPQFIKAAPVTKTFNSENIEEIIVHTGQHFDDNMSEIFFKQMNIPQPKYNLGINSVSHGAMTGRMVEKIEKILIDEQPDIVLVYGDTNSTIAGALAAKKLHIKVGHVEAGLRSFNKRMPEEINRVLTDRISDLLFCPTETSRNNLIKEGLQEEGVRIILSGDVMYDAALMFSKLSEEKTKILEQLNISPGNFLLCTIHRQENVDNTKNLSKLVQALNILSENHQIVLPVHPRTFNKLNELSVVINENIKQIKPVGYLEMIALVKYCNLVLTDSGGLQKEAYFFKKYCITLREETEWVELVQNGYNFLSGTDVNKIVNLTKTLLKKNNFESNYFYGDGNACKIICSEILKMEG